MKVYLLIRTTREGDRDSAEPFSTFEKAQQVLRKKLNYWNDEELNNYKKYGSDFGKGCIYTEEDTWEIIEKEME